MSDGQAPIFLANINNDGFPDIAYVSKHHGGLAVLMNDGKNGNFQNAVEIFIFQPFFTRDDIGSIHFVDMNGDGLDDIFIGTSSDFDNNKIFLNSGDGTFQYTINASKDFGPAYVFLLVNKGNGSFEDPVTIVKDDAKDGTYHSFDVSFLLSDMNGDGSPDFLLYFKEFGLNIFLGNGDGTFQDPTRVPCTSINYSDWETKWRRNRMENRASLAVADMNNDGKAGLLIGNKYQKNRSMMHLGGSNISWGGGVRMTKQTLGFLVLEAVTVG